MSGASEERSGLLVNGTNLSISNDDIRDALNLSAWYPSASTWDPTSGTLPISPVAPCTQVGWGVVNLSNIQPLYNHLAGIDSMPQRPADVVHVWKPIKPCGKHIGVIDRFPLHYRDIESILFGFGTSLLKSLYTFFLIIVVG